MDDPLLDAADEYLSNPLRASDLDSPPSGRHSDQSGQSGSHTEWMGTGTTLSPSHRLSHSKSPQRMKVMDKEFHFLTEIWDKKKTNILRPYKRPSVMQFTSKFKDRRGWHQMKLDFDVDQRVFHITIDEETLPHPIEIFHPIENRPFEAYELHVGLSVDVLGKPTRLESAVAKTREWLDKEARRLFSLVEMLQKEVRKFVLRSPPRSIVLRELERIQKTPSTLGGVADLSLLRNEALRLMHQLEKYQ